MGYVKINMLNMQNLKYGQKSIFRYTVFFNFTFLYNILNH